MKPKTEIIDIKMIGLNSEGREVDLSNPKAQPAFLVTVRRIEWNEEKDPDYHLISTNPRPNGRKFRRATENMYLYKKNSIYHLWDFVIPGHPIFGPKINLGKKLHHKIQVAIERKLRG